MADTTINRQMKGRRAGMALCLIGLPLALAACHTSIPRTPPRAQVFADSDESVLVFSPGQAEPWLGWETQRRDGALAVRTPETLSEFDSWQGPPRPDITQLRRIYLTRSTAEILYFRRTERFPAWDR